MDGNKFVKDGHTYMSGIIWLFIGSKIKRDKSEGQYLLCVKYGRT